jgi:hypothetical protein
MSPVPQSDQRKPGSERRGPFWDVLEGRRDPPPAAVLLGWKLVSVDPEAETIEVRRGREVAFLAGELRGQDGSVVATATASAIIRSR